MESTFKANKNCFTIVSCSSCKTDLSIEHRKEESFNHVLKRSLKSENWFELALILATNGHRFVSLFEAPRWSGPMNLRKREREKK